MKASDYQNLGVSCVPLLPRTKRPPAGYPLRKHLYRPATAGETSRWFDDGRMGVGVVLGAVSDNLTVRDFDDSGAFHRWAAEYPALANCLPTAKTSRGYHIYFCADTQDVHDAGNGQSDIIFCGDGELRHAGYSVAPESIHPSGMVYESVIPPSDFPFVSDLKKAGFLPRGTHNIERPLSGDLGGDWNGTEVPVTVAVETAQPTGPLTSPPAATVTVSIVSNHSAGNCKSLRATGRSFSAAGPRGTSWRFRIERHTAGWTC